MRSLAIGLAFASFGVLAVFSATGARAQTAADIAAAVNKSCAVMSGEQKADSQSLQLLLMLDEDLADANPVATALYRGVVHQCPKAYLAYEQRKRASNPFANSQLVSGTQTSLTSGSSSTPQAAPAVFPMRCLANGTMASAQGATLLVRFAKRLASGHGEACSRASAPGWIAAWPAPNPRKSRSRLRTPHRRTTASSRSTPGARGRFGSTTRIRFSTPPPSRKARPQECRDGRRRTSRLSRFYAKMCPSSASRMSRIFERSGRTCITGWRWRTSTWFSDDIRSTTNVSSFALSAGAAAVSTRAANQSTILPSSGALATTLRNSFISRPSRLTT